MWPAKGAAPPALRPSNAAAGGDRPLHFAREGDYEPAPQPQKRLTRRQAAHYLCQKFFQISHTTLEAFASKGGGPPYYRAGRMVYYDIADLDAWATARWSPKLRSSSDD